MYDISLQHWRGRRIFFLCSLCAGKTFFVCLIDPGGYPNEGTLRLPPGLAGHSVLHQKEHTPPSSVVQLRAKAGACPGMGVEVDQHRGGAVRGDVEAEPAGVVDGAVLAWGLGGGGREWPPGPGG